MREAIRRQLLADMGITVWRLRSAEPTSAAADPAGSSGAAVAATADIAGPGRSAGKSTAGAHRDAAAAPAPASAPPAARSGEPPASAPAVVTTSQPPVETPWSVLSLALGRVVVLVDADSSRRDLRLMRDVGAAASGDWRSKPTQRRFDWPPRVAGGAVPTGAGGGARALKAFVEKDLADHQARLLLIAEPLLQRLPDAPPGCRVVVMPAPQALGRDAGAKRALWRGLRDHLAAEVGAEDSA